ncbi:MAG: hypothetical protein O3A92_13315 [Verrucomicrobia bacterium]|nr:hypothetical protein [Verrucomicrobiota bacterium]
MKCAPLFIVPALLALSLSPAHALTKAEALQLLGEHVLQPSANDDLICAWMTPQALAGGVISTLDGDVSVDIGTLGGGSYWFAYVDLEPCAFLEHDVLYVFIKDSPTPVGVIPTVVSADNWPALDGDEIEDGALIGGRRIEVLGDAVSTEVGAADVADADGVPNLVDADDDERIFLSWDPNTSPPTSHVIFDVTLSPAAVAGATYYVNTLIDLDQSGAWKNTPLTTEWVNKNQAFTPTGTGTFTLITPDFLWKGTGNPNGPTMAWTRMLLTRTETVDPGIFGVEGWDGSGAFVAGEVEDFKLYRNCCPGVGCPPPPGGGGDDDDDDDDDDDVPPETPPPGPLVGWDTLPVKYHALIIQGVDHGEDTAAREAADQMERLFTTQGYKPTRLSGNSKSAKKVANKDNIEKWICDLLPTLACQDRLMIYFIGHGKKATPGGQIRLRKKSSGDPGTYTGAELLAALDKIPACSGLRCDETGKCCNVTVIMESCYSGQWLAGLSGPGRNIITTSEGTTPSYFGTDGTGGAYSDAYTDCANPSNRAAVDGILPAESADGDVEPNELHEWAKSVIGSPYGQTQIPQGSDMTCPCVCPPTIWECICDAGGVVNFGPGIWLAGGSPVGASFDVPGGVVVPDGEPIYDHLELPVPPDQWNWGVQFPGFHGQMQIQGQVFGLPPLQPQIFLPLFDFSPAVSVPPGGGPFEVFFQVDVPGQQFFIGTEFGPGLNGPLNQMEQLIQDNPDFDLIPAYRSNRPPAAQEIPIELIPMELATPAGPPDWINLQWEPRDGAEYMIDAAFGDLNFFPLDGPIDNHAYTMPFDGLVPNAFFRIRSQPLGTGPTTGGP